MENLKMAIEIIRLTNQYLQICIIDWKNAYMISIVNEEAYKIYCKNKMEKFAEFTKQEIFEDDKGYRINFKI